MRGYEELTLALAVETVLTCVVAALAVGVEQFVRKTRDALSKRSCCG